MNIWLIKSGEPLPLDDEKVRLMRTGLLADALIKNNHKVTWFASTWSHQLKRYRRYKTLFIQYNDKLSLQLIDSGSYKKNKSLKRFIYNIKQAKQFKKIAKKHQEPDLIIASYPSIELAHAAIYYAEENNIPIIIDLRDMWPDIITLLAPKKFRPLFKIILRPLYKKAAYTIRNSTAVVAITEEFLKWGYTLSGRSPSQFHAVFPLACHQNLITPSIKSNNQIHFKIVYIGSLNASLPLEGLINLVTKKNLPVSLEIAGTNGQLKKYQKIANGNKKVTFLGWLNKTQIKELLQTADLGYAPYENRIDFMASIPNKIIEYLSAGVPILTSLQGVVASLIDSHQIGFNFNESNLESVLKEALNKKLLKLYSKNCIQLFNERFEAKKVYREYVEFAEKIFNSKNTLNSNKTKSIK